MDLYVFLNTKMNSSGILSLIGDAGLAPVRYLCNGKTVHILFRESGVLKREVTHTPAFASDERSILKTAFAIVFLVPGLLFAVSKALAYFYQDVRENHALAKDHFTPINRTIGTPQNPIKDRHLLAVELGKIPLDDRLHQPTNALIIHGDGNLTIDEDPGIVRLNPMKVILVGAKIMRSPSAPIVVQTRKSTTPALRSALATISEVASSSPPEQGYLHDALYPAGGGKWIQYPRFRNKLTIDAALNSQAPRREESGCCGFGGKSYHMVFEIPQQQ